MASGVVFVVDSSATEGALVGEQLATLGFEAAVYESEQACLTALAQREPLAILVSLKLASSRGDLCCQRIKENYAWRHLPIIVMTQTDQAHELMYCWRAAANDFLCRPISLDKLAPKLDVIRRSAQVRESDPSFAGRWVLLLEGSRFYRNAIGGNLEHAGLRVLYAEEPEEALELAEEHADQLEACLLGLPSLPNALELGATIAALPNRRKMSMLLLSPTPYVDDALQAQVLQLTGSEALDKRNLPFDLVLSKIFSQLKTTNVLELRSHERMPFFSVVEFSTDGQEWGCGFSYDVSVGGIFIRTLTPLTAGQGVTLRMDFIGQEVLSRGVVAWANAFQPRSTFTSPVGMGIRLTDVAPQLTSQIAGLSRHRPRGASPS